jgi:hypothetical protein
MDRNRPAGTVLRVEEQAGQGEREAMEGERGLSADWWQSPTLDMFAVGTAEALRATDYHCFCPFLFTTF